MIIVFQTKMKINMVYECIFLEKKTNKKHLYQLFRECQLWDIKNVIKKKCVSVLYIFSYNEKIQTSKNSLQN